MLAALGVIVVDAKKERLGNPWNRHLVFSYVHAVFAITFSKDVLGQWYATAGFLAFWV